MLRLPNLIATPHVGGNTQEVATHQGRIIAEELERLRGGQAPRHALNPETLAGFRWDEPRPEPSPELAEKLGKGPGPAVSDLQQEQGAPEPAARPAAAAAVTLAPGSAAAQIRTALEEILRSFLARIAADEAMKAFAKGAEDVTLHFTLSDLGSEFHIGFGAGQVIAEMGAPATQAPVQLKMRADLLDGMFTGRSNAMQAAMNGELSFSGDTAKAMTLTHIQDDLSRLYAAAREEVGDPGDLASLPDPQAGAAAARGTRRGGRGRHPPRAVPDRRGALHGPAHHRHRRQRERPHPRASRRGVDHAQPALQGRLCPRRSWCGSGWTAARSSRRAAHPRARR